MSRKSFLLLPLALIVAACGTIATPVFEEDLQETRVAQAATAAAETAAAPSATPTVTPSETPAPPTATPEPPTATAAVEEPEPTEPADEPGEAALTGDPDNGRTLFQTFYPQANFACNTCHLADSEAQLIGPGLLNIGERAAARVEGQSAEEYIRNSILHPSDYVVEGYPDMLMPQVYGDIFTDDEIDDLIAYLFTL